MKKVLFVMMLMTAVLVANAQNTNPQTKKIAATEKKAVAPAVNPATTPAATTAATPASKLAVKPVAKKSPKKKK